IFTNEVTRREAMRTVLKGSAYAAPVVLGAVVPRAVAAVSPPLPTTVTFSPAPGSPFAVGALPTSIAVGDFNGDGKPDLAVTNEFSNNVSVLLGVGNGGFTNAPGSPIAGSGGSPDGIAVGDFNGDGNPDLAFANENNTVSVLLGSGSRGFFTAPGSPFTVGRNATGVALGDFNGDGKLDLAVTNGDDNTVSVLLGNGSGGFTNVPGSPFAVGGTPTYIVVGDFNGDSKPDLAITNATGNTVSVLLGNGSGGFTNAPGSPFAVVRFPDRIAVGDFNGDGKPDLAVTHPNDNVVSVLLGNGSGGFTNAPGSPFAVSSPDGIAVGDFNGDGNPDLAVANSTGNTVSVLLGNGNGSFTNASGSPFAVGRNATGVALGDFNGDSKLDIAVLNGDDSTVSVLLQR
ncbi:MAG: VCBS repeat-containing protein, partial [Chloroflexota bacterium]|nr:VCBS repeat-containing protein [Chloroflexota bacterium]